MPLSKVHTAEMIVGAIVVVDEVDVVVVVSIEKL